MRTISDNSAVRLYHLGDDGTTSTLMYGSLGDALIEAGCQSDDVQAGLFLQTSNDVVGYLDLVHG